MENHVQRTREIVKKARRDGGISDLPEVLKAKEKNCHSNLQCTGKYARYPKKVK